LSDLSDDSPKICKPYLQLRAQVDPHVEPHYNTYVKPYVDRSRPYVDRFNKNIYTPASTFTKLNYGIYGAPQVARIQSFAEDTWSSTVKPRLELRREWLRSQYDQKLSPHVNQVTVATEPYVTRAKSEVIDIYESTLVPAFTKTLPYVQSAYNRGHYITMTVILPYVHTAEQSTMAFLSRRVWPQLVIVYGENVEPQLMKISERLGRYKDSKKLQAAVNEMDTSSNTSLTAKPTAATSSASSAASVAVPNASTPVPTQEEKEADTREKIESDLKTWQEKFAKAADKGAEDLQERVKEITSRQIDSQAHVVGKAHLIRLEETASKSIGNLKEQINDAVKGLSDEADEKDEDATYEEILKDIRAAGSTVREKAQAVRTWKQKYDNDTVSLVQAALQSTYNVIDNIRDLGLQEIGMRWAWMEGVTYQDWSKYHDLKSTFDEWRNGVEKVALDHTGLKSAREEGEAIQESGMETAEKAAKELARLKEVARWKVASRDSSDDFSVAGPAKRATQQVKKVAESIVDSVVDAPAAISEAVYGTQDTVESVTSKASDIFDSVVSAASTKTEEIRSAIIGTPAPASSIQSEASKIFGGVMAANVQAERQIVLENDFVEDDTFADKIQSMISAAGEKASDLTNAVSEALIKPTATKGSVESVSSLASEQYAKAMSAASSVLYGTTPGAVESLSSAASDKYGQAVTAYVEPLFSIPAFEVSAELPEL
jgi:hypothetical protein